MTDPERLELSGVTAEFGAADATGAREVTVTVHCVSPPEVQVTTVPPEIDPRSYALGWWNARMRQILDML